MPHREKFLTDYHLGTRVPTIPPTPTHPIVEPDDTYNVSSFELLAKHAPHLPSPFTHDPTTYKSKDELPIEGDHIGILPDLMLGIATPKRLANCHSYWKDTLHAPPHILKAIVEGWPVPWLNNTPPPPMHARNPPFSPSEALFLWNFAMDLEGKGIIKRALTKPTVTLACFCQEKTDTAPGAPKKYRFLVNGKPLKEYMDVPHFRLDDLKAFVSQLSPGKKYSFIKIDLSDAYFCLPIPEEDQQYFGFYLLNPQGEKVYFLFTCICQGTSQSSYVFDRLLKPVLKFWRANAPLEASSIYVDDCLGAAISIANAKLAKNILATCLTRAGFTINWSKCVDATYIFPALGFTLNFETFPATVTPTPKRIVVLTQDISAFLISPALRTPRSLCTIGGRIISMRFSLGSAALLHLRHVYRLVSSLVKGKRGWDTTLTLAPSEGITLALEELTYWQARLATPDGVTRAIWPTHLPTPWGQIFMDASDKAMAALVRTLTNLPAALVNLESISNLAPPIIGDFLVTPEGRALNIDNGAFEYLVAVQDILGNDQYESSCARELFTLYFLLLAKGKDWQNQSLQVFLDAKSIIPILNKGSNSPVEHSLSIRINNILARHSVFLQYIWISRKLNTASDLFSRFTDIDDYTINPHSLQRILAYFNVYPDIDLFASTANATYSRFISRFFQVGTTAVDALQQNLSGITGYAFPPVSMVTLFLTHVLRFQTRIVLVIPMWTGSAFWHILCPDRVHPAPFVHAYHSLTSHFPNPDICKGPIGQPSFLDEPNKRHKWEWGSFLIDTTHNRPTTAKPVFCTMAHFSQSHKCVACAHSHRS